MKSNVNKWIAKIESTVDERLKASGGLVASGIKDSIVDQKLIDTGALVNSITHNKDGNTVYIGTPIEGYPMFLNHGFRHYQSGLLVGPYFFMERGVSAKEEELRALWKVPIK